jgi:hypothetical protein
MFDNEVNTLTTSSVQGTQGTYAIQATFKSTRSQAIALLNVVASSVSVTVEDISSTPPANVYSKTQYLLGQVVDWYQYFFTIDDSPRSQAVFTDLPVNYPNSQTTIKVEGLSPVSIGICTFGPIITLGKTELGTSTGITDYSVKQTEEFGQTTFVRRAYSKRMSANVLINNAELNRIMLSLFEVARANH